jgi:O-antigen/teichoic acid export membrane protein
LNPSANNDDASGMQSRIRNGVFAQGFGLGVTIVIQLASVPLFLSVWSLEQYGKWLILSALPAYLAIADVGFVSVGINQIGMAIQNGDVSKALRIFQTILALLLFLTAIIMGTAGLVLPWLPLPGMKLAIFLLVCVTLGNLYMGLFDAVYRAHGQYPLITTLMNTGRLIEWLGGMIGLFLGRSFTSVAAGMCVARIGVLVFLRVLSKVRYPRFQWAVHRVRVSEFNPMWLPALSTMAFPLGAALNFSGLTLLLGRLFGAQFIGVFNAYRTLTRSAVQLMSLLNRAIWPEMTRLYGQGQLSVIRRLRRRIHGLTWVGLALCTVGLLGLGPRILHLWTHDKVAFHGPLFSGLVLVAVFNAAWQLDSIILLAINLHARFAIMYVLASIALLGGIYLCGAQAGALGPIVLMVISEVWLIWAANRSVQRIFKL